MKTNEIEMIAATKEVIAAYDAGAKPQWDRIQDALSEIPSHFAAKRKGESNQITWLAELVFNAITCKSLRDRAALWASIREICAAQ